MLPSENHGTLYPHAVCGIHMQAQGVWWTAGGAYVLLLGCVSAVLARVMDVPSALTHACRACTKCHATKLDPHARIHMYPLIYPHGAAMEAQWRMCNVAGSCVGQVDVLVDDVMPGGNPTLRQHASLNYAS